MSTLAIHYDHIFFFSNLQSKENALIKRVRKPVVSTSSTNIAIRSLGSDAGNNHTGGKGCYLPDEWQIFSRNKLFSAIITMQSPMCQWIGPPRPGCEILDESPLLLNNNVKYTIYVNGK